MAYHSNIPEGEAAQAKGTSMPQIMKTKDAGTQTSRSDAPFDEEEMSILKAARRFLIVARLFEQLCTEVGNDRQLGVQSESDKQRIWPILGQQDSEDIQYCQTRVKSHIETIEFNALVDEYDGRAQEADRPILALSAKKQSKQVWELLRTILEDETEFDFVK